MQIKQMLFPMMSMALTMAPCSHLHAQGQTPVSQMEKLDRGLVALPAQNQGIFLSWRLLGTDSKHVCFDIERDGKIIAHQVKLTNYTDRKGYLPIPIGSSLIRKNPGWMLRLKEKFRRR